MKKRILILSLCLMLLLALLPAGALAAQEELYTSVDTAADALREAMKDRQTAIELRCDFPEGTFELSEEGLGALTEGIFQQAMAHTGEGDEGDYLRWHYSSFDCNASHSVTAEGAVTTLNYDLGYYTTAQQEQQVTQAVETALASLELEGMSDYDKIFAIYSYIADTVAYDYQNLSDDSYKLKHTAYAAIIDETAVCQGYASLLYRMLLEAGIDNRVIVGTSQDENHAWNIVELEGQYYYLDVTWDEAALPMNYNYFLKGDDSFPDHNPEPQYTTEEFLQTYPISAQSYRTDALPDGSYEENGFRFTVKNGFAKVTCYEGNAEHVVVPATLGGCPVQGIGVSAFCDNHTMRTLTLSEGIRTMDTFGDTPIFRCDALEKLVLPASLEVDVPKLTDVLQNDTFGFYDLCPKIHTIEIAEGNKTVKSVDGVVYTPGMDTILCYPSNKPGESYTVPESVTFVCHGAFKMQNYLKKVTLPDCVIRIGYWAFSNCQKLEELNTPADCKYIGQFAFNQTKIKEFHYGANVGWMLPRVFSNAQIETITVHPDNDYYILVDGVVYTRGEDGQPEKLFHYPIADKRDTYVMPDGVTEMDPSVLYFAQNLRTVILSDDLTAIPDAAFFSAQNLERLVIPASVTSIGQSAFANDWRLVEIYYEGTQAQWDQIMTEALGPEQRVHFNVTDPENHSRATGTVEPPTCGREGYTIYTCPCGYEYERDYTPRIPHTDVSMMYYDEQTHVRFCYACSSYADETIQYLPHNFVGNFCPECHYTDPNRDPNPNPDPDPQPSENPFKDVKQGAFYYNSVLWAVEKGVTSGMTPTSFEPGTTCTRGQVVTFLWRAKGCPEPTSTKNPFKDVKSGAFYYKAVLWAVENGITSGTGEGKFSPDDPCTRGQVVTFLWRTMEEPAPQSNDNPFKDVKFGAFYYDAVLWAVDAGVTSGISKTSFAPGDPCTRGQVVTFLYRTLN